NEGTPLSRMGSSAQSSSASGSSMRRVTALLSSRLLPISATPVLPALVLDLVPSALVAGSENTESNLLVPAGAALAAAAAFARTVAALAGATVSSVKFVRAGLCSSKEGG